MAGGRNGAISHADLVGLGLTPTMIDKRVRRGSLHVVHRGVYIVGHLAVNELAYPTAALLACAPRALLSFATAGWIWGFCPNPGRPVDITVVGRRPSRQEGIALHYLGEIARSEIRRRHGLPVTSPALTLLDLSGVLPEREFHRALNEARVQRRVNDREMQATLAGHPKRRGARALRVRLESEAGAFATESEAAAGCLELMIAADLKPDEVEAKIGRYRVDFLYLRERLVVEVDGFRFHSTPDRFVRDRRRTAELMSRGYEVFPVTWFDLTDASKELIRRLRQTLERRRKSLGAVESSRFPAVQAFNLEN